VGQVVTVFGGTGFLGRRVVRHLRDKGFSVRVASRHAKASSGHDPEIRPTAADVRERQSISTAIEGAFGVVNAVSLYVERGTDTFQAVHVAAAERLAAGRNIIDADGDQIATAQLAVDRQVEQRQVALPVLDLQLGPDRPNVARSQRRFGADYLAFVPGWAASRLLG
jgi:uncharacterized protein YbjT (DUF2867 family)